MLACLDNSAAYLSAARWCLVICVHAIYARTGYHMNAYDVFFAYIVTEKECRPDRTPRLKW